MKFLRRFAAKLERDKLSHEEWLERFHWKIHRTRSAGSKSPRKRGRGGPFGTVGADRPRGPFPGLQGGAEAPLDYEKLPPLK